MAYSCCDVMHQNIVNKDLQIAVSDKPQGLHGNKIKIMNRELFNIYVRFIKRTENTSKTPCTMTETLSLMRNILWRLNRLMFDLMFAVDRLEHV